MRGFIFPIIFALMITNLSGSQETHTDKKVVKESQTNVVIVYGSDTCHYCIDTKTFLQENQVTFVYYDVDLNLVKQKEMLQKLQKAGISIDAISLPVVDLNGKLKMNTTANFEGFLKSLIAKNN